jgi:hypothetical protein
VILDSVKQLGFHWIVIGHWGCYFISVTYAIEIWIVLTFIWFSWKLGLGFVDRCKMWIWYWFNCILDSISDLFVIVDWESRFQHWSLLFLLFTMATKNQIVVMFIPCSTTSSKCKITPQDCGSFYCLFVLMWM